MGIVPKVLSSVPARLRFAPSPTGFLHIGGLRTALFNHLIARRLKGKWLLRIEDTDQTRVVPGSVDALRRDLEWAGLDYDEGPGVGGDVGPYTQSERLDVYKHHIKTLLDSGDAYPCFCSETQLSEIRQIQKLQGKNSPYDRRCLHRTPDDVARRIRDGQKHVIRFKSNPGAVSIPHTDLVYGGTHAVSPTDIDDLILIKADGYPTYHFASIVDDHLMGITHVLRGQEWLSSVNKHLQLYNAFGWAVPQFAHLPLIFDTSGKKLSKRTAGVQVSEYIDKGYEPAAILNWIALMGWNHVVGSGPGSALTNENEDDDFFPMERLISTFEISKINTKPGILFPPRLEFLQRKHLNARWETPQGHEDILDQAQALLTEKYPDNPSLHDKETIERVMAVVEGNRIGLVTDLTKDPMAFFFSKPDLSTIEARQLKSNVSDEAYVEVLNAILPRLRSLDESEFNNVESLWSVIYSIEEDIPVKGSPSIVIADKVVKRNPRTKILMTPLRHSLSGKKNGPNIAQIMLVLQKQEVIDRVEHALKLARKDITRRALAAKPKS